MNTLDDFEAAAKNALAASRKLARSHFRQGLEVDHKSDQSPVTQADRAIEESMKAVLSGLFPEHGIFGEEFGVSGSDARYLWVLDPIDGTKSFISGVPIFGTLVALLDNGSPVLGGIDIPILNETWIARKDSPTQINGKPCRSGSCEKLDEAILFATSPDQFDNDEYAAFEALSSACSSRRFGGDCYSYGLLASGHIDLIMEAGLEPYDYLALVPVVTGAGGVITDWQGMPLTLQSKGQVIAAATPALHRAALLRLSICP